MNSFDKVKGIYLGMAEETSNDTAAAILTLATVLYESLYDFDHQVCLGIRHGLFGKNARDDMSLRDDITDFTKALHEITEGMPD